MRFYELKCDKCENTGIYELTEEQLIQKTSSPHRNCAKSPPGSVSAKEMKIIVRSLPNKYKEKLEENRVNLEYENSGSISDDTIIYHQQSSEEKIKFVDSLHKKALISMKEPEMVSPNKYRVIGSMDRMVNYHKELENQHFCCLLCGIGANPSYNISVRRTIAKDVLELKPHEIVYSKLGGDLVPENIVMLCKVCHDKEYKLIKEHCWNEFVHCWSKFVNTKEKEEWRKLIEKSFDCFRRVIKYLDRQEDI